MNTSNWTRGKVLGRGSTATVSLAASSSSGQLLAVKWSHLSQSQSLQHEAAIHSCVPSSPYVVSYLGHETTHERTGSYYNILLEYAPNGSLSDEVRCLGHLPEAHIRARARDILLGLSHLHKYNIAHCDVKPRNVLIGADGRAKIADLGCAKFVDSTADHRRFVGGTPMFMSPEVARGEEQGTAADVWAVGCTVIEMATGGAPWPDATDAVSLLHRVGFSGDVPKTADWLSEEAKDFVSKCFGIRACDRWTVDELLRHSFVLDSETPRLDCKQWTSPKSTLDRGFWDSVETEEAVDSVDGKANAVSDLFGQCSSSAPDWTWDGSWMTVRVTDEEEEDNTQIVSVEISEEEEEEEEEAAVVISANRGVVGELEVVISDNCERVDQVVIRSDNCEHSVTMLLLLLLNCKSGLCYSCQFALVRIIILGLYMANVLRNIAYNLLHRIFWGREFCT